MVKIACPKCNSKKLYKMSSGKRRCSECKYDFIPHNLPLRLTRDEWKHIIRLFLMEQNSNSIVERTKLERRRVFRALTKIRIVLVKDVLEIFSGTVKLMKHISEDNGKNKRKSIRDHGTKRGRGTKKQPVFGILCWNGQVWAEVIDNVEALQPLILKKSINRIYHLF